MKERHRHLAKMRRACFALVFFCKWWEGCRRKSKSVNLAHDFFLVRIISMLMFNFILIGHLHICMYVYKDTHSIRNVYDNGIF